MNESAQPEFVSSFESDIRALLAKISPEERALLRQLLAVADEAAPTSGTATIDCEGIAPLSAPLGEPLGEEAGSSPEHSSFAADPGETLCPSPAPADGSPAMPVVPGYEILHEIGRGGMGVVYQARHSRLNRLVALKMILSGSAASERDMERFRAEAQTVAQFQHPHIVQVFEVGECTVESGATHPYMALELCLGGSLASMLDGEPWPAAESAELVELLARTVHAAHQAEVVHRDLKPANILLALQGPLDRVEEQGEREPATAAAPSRLAGWTPKITDFGLAKRLADGAGRTQSGAILGTPEYMAPEQAAGKTKDIGPLADVYALGTILYELLTGSPPLRADTPLDTLLKVLETEPAPARARNPAVPRDLETICLKCLRKEPAKRYGSALELAEDLRRHLDGEPIRARPPGPIERANRQLKQRPGLTIASIVFVVGVLLFVKLHGAFLPGIFAMKGVSSSGFEYIVLPAAALSMGLVLWADLRWAGVAGLVAGVGAASAWLIWPSSRPEIDATGLFLRPLAWGVLAAVLFGFLPRGRRLLLLLLVLALLIEGGAAWLIDGGAAPFLAGVCHGLPLGLLARIVAWGLQRDRATCALGAVLGACLGLLVSDRYGTTVLAYLRESQIRPRLIPVQAFYLEGCLAFPVAVVCGLIFGKRPSSPVRSSR